jgi:hypothetical protein
VVTFVHLTAHALTGKKPFVDPDVALCFWRSLQRLAPHAVAACLMPNHPHLVVPTDAPDKLHAQFAQRLAAFARAHNMGRTWQRVPPAEVVRPDRLVAVIRYVHLNPPRGGLVGDPLEWLLSTHRGVVGAELDPWVTADRLADVLGRRREHFEAWFHRIVTDDSSVRTGGTPLPQPAPARIVPAVPLEQIALAAHSAAHGCRIIERRALVALARHQGWKDAALIARVAGITPDSVRRLARRPEPELVRVGALCLNDARLRCVPRARHQGS